MCTRLAATLLLGACQPQVESERPCVLVSTDIGGPDEDDFQSMGHLLMFNDYFDLEGLVSSPSFGGGGAEHTLNLIDLYAQDFSGGNFRTAEELGMDREFMRSVMQAIHEESIRHQQKVIG